MSKKSYQQKHVLLTHLFTQGYIYSLPHSTKDLRWNDFILKGPDKALSNGYHLDSKENSENMGQNRGSNRHQHVNRPHLGASLQVENALIVKSILFREFLQWYKLYQTDTSFHSP